MVAESMWPGMFHAEAGRGNTASVRNTRDASSLICSIGSLYCQDVICHGQSTRSTTTRKGSVPAIKFNQEAGNGYKNHCRFTRQFSSQFTWPRSSAGAEKSCSYGLPSIWVDRK